MPRRPGIITRRADPAGPYSLNEPGQPQRNAESAGERCAQLAAIIDWLAVDKPAHKRYQPTGGGTTFCNIYAHDYCFLANVYLPRVWWTPGAIEQLGKVERSSPSTKKLSTSSAPTIYFAGWVISGRALAGGKPER